MTSGKLEKIYVSIYNFFHGIWIYNIRCAKMKSMKDPIYAKKEYVLIFCIIYTGWNQVKYIENESTKYVILEMNY